MPIIDDILRGIQVQLDALWYNVLFSLAGIGWGIQRGFIIMGYSIELLNQWLVEESFAAKMATIHVDPAAVPLIREHYTRDLEERLGYSRPEERRKLEAALEDVKQEESRAARLYAAGRISDDIWEELWQDWCDRRTKLITSLESLERAKETHISNLDAALDIISRIGVRYGQLEPPQQRQLLQEVVERVIVNAQGDVIDLELLAPFDYLRHVKEQVEAAQQGETKSDTAESVACSDSVSLGDPIGISGRKLLHLRRLAETVLKFVSLLYPASFLSTVERNQLIQARHAEGIGLSALAEQFGISPQRVYQIVHGKHH